MHCHNKWGTNKSTFRHIYLGYVRSAMDYARLIQTIASKANRESLDKIQNQSLRLTCGGMRSTPSLIYANVEPLDLRREQSVLSSKVWNDTNVWMNPTQTEDLLKHGDHL